MLRPSEEGSLSSVSMHNREQTCLTHSINPSHFPLKTHGRENWLEGFGGGSTSCTFHLYLSREAWEGRRALFAFLPTTIPTKYFLPLPNQAGDLTIHCMHFFVHFCLLQSSTHQTFLGGLIWIVIIAQLAGFGKGPCPGMPLPCMPPLPSAQLPGRRQLNCCSSSSTAALHGMQAPFLKIKLGILGRHFSSWHGHDRISVVGGGETGLLSVSLPFLPFPAFPGPGAGQGQASLDWG